MPAPWISVDTLIPLQRDHSNKIADHGHTVTIRWTGSLKLAIVDQAALRLKPLRLKHRPLNRRFAWPHGHEATPHQPTNQHPINASSLALTTTGVLLFLARVHATAMTGVHLLLAGIHTTGMTGIPGVTVTGIQLLIARVLLLLTRVTGILLTGVDHATGIVFGQDDRLRRSGRGLHLQCLSRLGRPYAQRQQQDQGHQRPHQ